MKGHPLFWHEFIPSWLTKYTFTEQKKLIAKRFREIAERFANRCERFDVVNEPSRIYDVYMRDRARGGSFLLPEDDYCLWLFDLARQLFPSNTLILNDTVGASFHEFRGKIQWILPLTSRICFPAARASTRSECSAIWATMAAKTSTTANGFTTL